MDKNRIKIKPGIDFIGVSAGAMIFNNRGELFLSKRSKNATNEKGHWETPGGRIEFGETLQQAVMPILLRFAVHQDEKAD